jgi:hypothetical protein
MRKSTSGIEVKIMATIKLPLFYQIVANKKETIRKAIQQGNKRPYYLVSQYELIRWIEAHLNILPGGYKKLSLTNELYDEPFTECLYNVTTYCTFKEEYPVKRKYQKKTTQMTRINNEIDCCLIMKVVLPYKYNFGNTKESHQHPKGITVTELDFINWIEYQIGLQITINKNNPLIQEALANCMVYARTILSENNN